MSNLPLWFLPLLCLIIIFIILGKIPTYVRNTEPILTKEQLEELKTNFNELIRINDEQEKEQF